MNRSQMEDGKTKCNNIIQVGDVIFSQNSPLALIAGPCQLESHQHAYDMVGILKEIAYKHKIGFVYKSSFDKANRTSISSKRGVGIEKSIEIFVDLKKDFSVPIITDIHLPQQAEQLAPVVDILQIPAFLCRQTDLLVAAAKTGRVINVKKGQFLAPWDMQYVLEKIIAAGNSNVMLCERGTCFGYNRLINDMRSLEIMASFGAPVIFDATHSVQEPGAMQGASGGQSDFVPALARAAVAIGVAGLFLEIHENPAQAPSDGANMLTPKQLDNLLDKLLQIDKIAKN